MDFSERSKTTDRDMVIRMYETGRRDDNHFILRNFKAMTSHEDTQAWEFFARSVRVENKPRKIYGVINSRIVNGDKIMALVKVRGGYVAFDNERNSEGNVRSRIWFDASLPKLIKNIPSKVRKGMNLIEPKKKMSIPKYHITDLYGLKNSDLLHFISLSGEVLDLSGLPNLSENTFDGLHNKYQHPAKTIILNSSIHMVSMKWLKVFPNLRQLVLWHINVPFDNFPIHEYCPELEILEYHMCPNVSGRVLINTLKHPNISQFIIDNPVALFHEERQLDHSVILDEEWESIPSTSKITRMMINSGNLSRDFIKPMLDHMPDLTNLILNDNILQQLEKNTSDGVLDEEISFHAESNTNSGFKRRREVRVHELMKDMYGPVFSKSMLEIIKKRAPGKRDAANILLE